MSYQVIKEKLEIFKGKNLVLLDQKKLINQIYNLDFVRDIKIKKIYPNKIIVTINEYKPLNLHSRNIESSRIERNEFGKSYFNWFRNLS